MAQQSEVWTRCTHQLAELPALDLQLLQLQRMVTRNPDGVERAQLRTVRNLNMLILASFLSNLN